jgi:hypothetical protein
MGNFVRIAGVLFASLVLLPAAILAQGTASIGGVVRDASGAVLPGVTVEASSPALIEKARTVITDGSGQYKIEQLRPGIYTVTFTLTGFNGVRREGIELAGSFAANVNSELKVGAVEETITVTAESPLVDVQSATKQRVLSNEVLTDIPTGRTQFAAATLIAGMNLNNQDVGGTNIINTQRPGNGRGLLVGHGRPGDRWRPHQPDSARRRQRVQGIDVRHRRQLLVPGRQLYPGVEGSGAEDAQQHQAAVRLQPGIRRAAQGEQGVVLLVGPVGEDGQLRRRNVRQPERREAERL